MTLTTSSSIRDFKNTLVSTFVGSSKLIEAMGNSDITDSDEAVYKYIFPFFYIPYTIESAHSYICMKVNMTGISDTNSLIGDFSIIVWVIVHQDIMKMENVGGATRMDYLSDIVESLLAGSDAFGTRRLTLQTNTESELDIRHRCRILTFETSDITDVQCGTDS